jgi:carboxyl-terminal processing protease
MKKTTKAYSILVIILAFVVNACAGVQTEVPPTQPPASLTPTQTPLPEPTATPTKKAPSGPLATAQALAAQTTLVPPTPVGGVGSVDIAADDYVGIFKQAWAIVEAEYVRDNYNGVDWDAVYDEYLPKAEQVQSSEELHVLLADLIHELGDSHSRFVPPSRMQAEFGVGSSDGTPRPWTGIQVWPGPGREDQYLSAWYVCELSPAALAGIETGDSILAVDGEKVTTGSDGIIDSTFVSGAVFGTGGDSVTLTIQSGPDESPRDVTVELGGAGGCDDWRHMIVNESPRIGYIRVPDFDGNAGSNILSAIRDMEKDAPLEGLILDVRHNPGGNSDDSAGIFADGIVGTVGALREGKQRQIYRIRGVDWNDTTPLVVLTDGSSHSAADYFPAAMKELERATIIGTNSAGNTEGIVSRSLADGTLIRLAITTLLLNDGTSLEGVGVTPQVYVPLGQWGLKQKPYDVQLQAAIDYLLGK